MQSENINTIEMNNNESAFTFITRKITNNTSQINQNKLTVIYEKENKDKNPIISTMTFCLKDTEENFNQNKKASYYKISENNKENIKQNYIKVQKKYNINVPSSTSTSEIYISEKENNSNKKNVFNDCNIKNLNFPYEYLLDIFTNILKDSTKKNYSLEKILLIQSKDIIKNRQILINWLSLLHFICHYNEMTFYLTINLLDSYLSKKKISNDKLQLLGIVCFWISSKYNEVFNIPLSYFEKLKLNFKKEEILNFEYEVLETLNYNISISTVYEIYSYLSLRFSFNETDFYFGLFMLEVFQLDIKSTNYHSLIIAESICYLVYYINYKQNLNLKDFVIKDDEHKVRNCITEIFEDCKNIVKTPFENNVIKKFSNEKYKKICIVYNIVNK